MSAKVETKALLNIEMSSNRVKIGLALLAVYVIWGSTYLAALIAVQTIPPFMMSGVRFLIAGSIMFIFLRIRGAAMPSAVHWRNALGVAFLMLGVGTGGVAFAEQWVASGLAATAVAAMPLWAALFAGLWGRWPRKLEWAGLALGLVGVAMLNLENGMQANPVGAIVLILSPMCWALGSIWSRQLSLPRGLMATALEMLGGGVVLVIMSVIFGEKIPAQPSLQSILAVLYLITFGALIAFSAYMYLLGTVRPAVATSYAYVNPIVAVMLGVLLAGEQISPLGIVAMCVILAGVGLIAFAREHQTASA